MRKLFFDIFGAGWGTTRPYLRVPSESGGDRPPVARGGVRVANSRRSRELCSKTVRTPTAELFGEKQDLPTVGTEEMHNASTEGVLSVAT